MLGMIRLLKQTSNQHFWSFWVEFIRRIIYSSGIYSAVGFDLAVPYLSPLFGRGGVSKCLNHIH